MSGTHDATMTRSGVLYINREAYRQHFAKKQAVLAEFDGLCTLYLTPCQLSTGNRRVFFPTRCAAVNCAGLLREHRVEMTASSRGDFERQGQRLRLVLDRTKIAPRRSKRRRNEQEPTTITESGGGVAGDLPSDPALDCGVAPCSPTGNEGVSA